MSEKVNSAEYFFIRCHKCNEQVKIAKNKGNHFVSYDNIQEWIAEFFDKHSDCEMVHIELISEQ
jgi:hypothetical protein